VALGVLPAPAQVYVAMHSVQPGVALVEVLFRVLSCLSLRLCQFRLI
jgi:hypothetical protein